MSVHVHIERLVLHGLDVSQGEAADLQQTLQARLTQLLAAQSADQRPGKNAWIASAQAPAVSIGRKHSGSTLGERAAESLSVSLSAPSQQQYGSQYPAGE